MRTNAIVWRLGAVIVAAVVVGGGCAVSRQPPGQASSVTTSSRPTTTTPPTTVSVAASPRAGRIVFSAGPAHAEDIYVVNADGSGLKQLTSDPAAEFDPAWSPDGRRVAYRHQTGDDATAEIYVMNADGSGQRNLTNNSVAEWGPAWSPDGKLIAFGSGRDSPEMRLYVIQPDGTGVRRLGDIDGEYPAWSPDGTRIAFASLDGAVGGSPDFNIYVMNANGTGVRRLTDSPSQDDWPAWSPDGTRIAFASARDDQGQGQSLGPTLHLYVMRADGSGQTRLTDAFAQFAAWSPDGRDILFSPGLTIMGADGSGATRLAVSGVPGEPEFPDWIS